MKRVKHLSAETGVIKINIKVEINTDGLTILETERAMSKIASDCMCAIQSAPYTQIYLANIKVK